MKKKLLALLLCVLMLVGLVPTMAFAHYNEEPLVYEKVDSFTEDGYYLIVSNGRAMSQQLVWDLFDNDYAKSCAVTDVEGIITLDPDTNKALAWYVTLCAQNRVTLQFRNGEYLASTLVPGVDLENVCVPSHWVLSNDYLYNVSSNDHFLKMEGDHFVAGYANDPCTITLYKLKVAPKLSDCDVTVPDADWTGSPYAGPITVMDGERELVKGEDYTVSYYLYDENGLNGCGLAVNGVPAAPGKYVVKLTGEGEYTGAVYKVFTINPQVTYHANGGHFSKGGVRNFGQPTDITLYPTFGDTAFEILTSYPDGRTGAISVSNTGKILAGWYEDPACTVSYDFTKPATANFDLYAKWVDEVYDVAVTATKSRGWSPYGGQFYADVTAKLMRGNEIVAVKRAGNGQSAAEFTFENVPAGNYTLNVEYSNRYGHYSVYATATIPVIVSADKASEGVVLVPVELYQDKVYIITVGEDTPDTTVEGLEDAIGDAHKFEVIVDANHVNEDGKHYISLESGDHKSYFEITVKQDDVQIYETGSLLTFTIEFPTGNRENFKLYRTHNYGTAAAPDWRVDKLTKTENEFGEKIIEVGNDHVTFCAKNFSVYAIAWDDPKPAPSYGGSAPTTYKVTTGDGVTADKKTATANTTITLTVASGMPAPTVKDADGNLIAVTKQANGTYTFKMPTSEVTVSVVCPRDKTCPIDAYDDTLNDYWWHDGIHYCLEHDLMVGFPDGTFQPNGTITRAQAAVILWRIAGCLYPDYAISFKDVEAGAWYTPAIRWAEATGVVKGYSKDQYGPNDPVTREQLAAMIYRYAQDQGLGFTGSWMFLLDYADRAEICDWAYEAVCWCTMKGVILGDEGSFYPDRTATRAEAACMFQRFCQGQLGK